MKLEKVNTPAGILRQNVRYKVLVAGNSRQLSEGIEFSIDGCGEIAVHAGEDSTVIPSEKAKRALSGAVVEMAMGYYLAEIANASRTIDRLHEWMQAINQILEEAAPVDNAAAADPVVGIERGTSTLEPLRCSKVMHSHVTNDVVINIDPKVDTHAGGAPSTRYYADDEETVGSPLRGADDAGAVMTDKNTWEQRGRRATSGKAISGASRRYTKRRKAGAEAVMNSGTHIETAAGWLELGVWYTVTQASDTRKLRSGHRVYVYRDKKEFTLTRLGGAIGEPLSYTAESACGFLDDPELETLFAGAQLAIWPSPYHALRAEAIASLAKAERRLVESGELDAHATYTEIIEQAMRSQKKVEE